jgi:hypothetical protein
MATQVQQRRGTTAEHASFTGAVGEITVDTTKDTAVVHDGTTAGGHPLLKEAAIGVSVQAYDANLPAGNTILVDGDIGTSVQAYDADTAKTDVAQTFTAAQRGSVSALTSAATITPDLAVANNYSLSLATNTTLANPTNITAGQSGTIVITNGGSYTMAFGSYWKFPGGTAPTLTASATDVLAYYVESSTRITARLISDVK